MLKEAPTLKLFLPQKQKFCHQFCTPSKLVAFFWGGEVVGRGGAWAVDEAFCVGYCMVMVKVNYVNFNVAFATAALQL